MNFSTAPHSEFEEGQTIVLKLKNVGYKIEGIDDRVPFKKFPTKDGFAVDLNCVRQGIFWQIVLAGADIQDAVTHGDFFNEDTESWVQFPVLECQKYYIVRGEYKLKELDNGTRPELVLFDPSGIVLRSESKRPPRPSEVARRKATNKANQKRNAKENTKAKAKTGKATPRSNPAA